MTPSRTLQQGAIPSWQNTGVCFLMQKIALDSTATPYPATSRSAGYLMVFRSLCRRTTFACRSPVAMPARKRNLASAKLLTLSEQHYAQPCVHLRSPCQHSLHFRSGHGEGFHH